MENLLIVFSVGIFAIFGSVMAVLLIILFWIKT